MAETQKKRSPVILAVLLFVLAAIALGAVFYFFDGASVVKAYTGFDLAGFDWFGLFASEEPEPGPGMPPGTTTATPDPSAGLQLPQGVSEEFALRLWQEQIDSQENIEKLVNGEVKELKIGVSEYDAYEGLTQVVAVFDDGTSAPGELHMAKQGENWYVRYLSGLRERDTGGSADTVNTDGGEPETPLPDIEDVDVAVLNTMFAEQDKSQEVFQDYLQGNVQRVVIREVQMGAGTATILATMYEKDHTADAQIVAVVSDVGGEETWFLARFEKTAEVPNS